MGMGKQLFFGRTYQNSPGAIGFHLALQLQKGVCCTRSLRVVKGIRKQFSFCMAATRTSSLGDVATSHGVVLCFNPAMRRMVAVVPFPPKEMKFRRQPHFNHIIC